MRYISSCKLIESILYWSRVRNLKKRAPNGTGVTSRTALSTEMRLLSACRKVREGTRAARTMNWRAPLEPEARQKCWKLARKLSLLVRCRRTRDGDAANGGAARVQRAVQAAAPTKAGPTSPALCGARRHHHWRPRRLPGCVQRGWVLPAFKIYLWFFSKLLILQLA